MFRSRLQNILILTWLITIINMVDNQYCSFFHLYTFQYSLYHVYLCWSKRLLTNKGIFLKEQKIIFKLHNSWTYTLISFISSLKAWNSIRMEKHDIQLVIKQNQNINHEYIISECHNHNPNLSHPLKYISVSRILCS